MVEENSSLFETCDYLYCFLCAKRLRTEQHSKKIYKFQRLVSLTFNRLDEKFTCKIVFWKPNILVSDFDRCYRSSWYRVKHIPLMLVNQNLSVLESVEIKDRLVRDRQLTRVKPCTYQRWTLPWTLGSKFHTTLSFGTNPNLFLFQSMINYLLSVVFLVRSIMMDTLDFLPWSTSSSPAELFHSVFSAIVQVSVRFPRPSSLHSHPFHELAEVHYDLAVRQAWCLMPLASINEAQEAIGWPIGRVLTA